MTRADKGFVIELADGTPEVRASRNVAPGNVEDAVSRVSDSIVQRVLTTRRPLVVADALHDAEWSSSASVVDLRLQSVMCAPLVARGEIFGAIYLGNDSVRNLFDERSLETLTVFSSQASLLLQNALLLRDLRRENEALREAIESRRYGELLGAGPSMREVYRRIEKVAPTDVTVLIQGETGTGKELVAREIHRRSPRGVGPFVAVNCAAIPEGLLESELFGHVKGAFTGAVASRAGRFQAASGGTLFLDEIGEMPPCAPGEAPAGHPGAGRAAGRRVPRRAGRHPGGGRHQPEPGGRGPVRDGSARTSTTASTSSPSTCRRSGSAETTSRSWPAGSCSATRTSSTREPAGSRPERSPRSGSTPGPATSASSRTA